MKRRHNFMRSVYDGNAGVRRAPIPGGLGQVIRPDGDYRKRYARPSRPGTGTIRLFEYGDAIVKDLKAEGLRTQTD
jgi:hypothetical protein